MPTVIRKIFTVESEEELLDMKRDEVTDGMADREVLFCEYYIRNHNIKTACIKAGYGKTSAHIVGYKLRRKPLVNRYICWLKLQVSKVCMVEATDIVEQYAKIAYADITDFVEIKNNRVKLLNADEIDGQLIKRIKQGKDGVSIELHDPLVALDKLERYFDVMPSDWREKIEIQKLEIMRERLAIERLKIEGPQEPDGDDGFMEALKSEAITVWGNVEEEQIDGEG
jgi:phage terminase small subunit